MRRDLQVCATVFPPRYVRTAGARGRRIVAAIELTQKTSQRAEVCEKVHKTRLPASKVNASLLLPDREHEEHYRAGL